MFELQPPTRLMQVPEHYKKLLQEAEEQRLYRRAMEGHTKPLPGAQLALIAGNLLITLGQWLKHYAVPQQQVGQLISEQ